MVERDREGERTEIYFQSAPFVAGGLIVCTAILGAILVLGIDSVLVEEGWFETTRDWISAAIFGGLSAIFVFFIWRIFGRLKAEETTLPARFRLIQRGIPILSVLGLILGMVFGVFMIQGSAELNEFVDTYLCQELLGEDQEGLDICLMVGDECEGELQDHPCRHENLTSSAGARACHEAVAATEDRLRERGLLGEEMLLGGKTSLRRVKALCILEAMNRPYEVVR